MACLGGKTGERMIFGGQKNIQHMLFTSSEHQKGPTQGSIAASDLWQTAHSEMTGSDLISRQYNLTLGQASLGTIFPVASFCHLTLDSEK